MQVKCVNDKVGRSNGKKGSRPVPAMLLTKNEVYEAAESEKPGTYVILEGALKGRLYRSDRFETI